MSRRMEEMLEGTSPTDELMEVDTSFLDAFRRGGGEALKVAQAREEQRQAQQAPAVPTADAAQPEAGTSEHAEPNLRPKIETATPDHDEELDEGKKSEPDLEPDHEAEPGDDECAGDAAEHGGGGSSGASATSGEMIPGTPPHGGPADAGPLAQEEVESVADAALDEDVVTEPMLPHAASGETTPGSLQLTDHQEAVQSSAASTKGGSGGTDDGAALPQSGFRLSGVKSQPAIRALPDAVVNALREQLRSAAVRELGVDDVAAREFSERLSQASLVMAFLLAQLNLALDADVATRRAAELFRSCDPLMNNVAARLDGLEKLEVEKRDLLDTLREQFAEVRQTTAVIEQLTAYSIADRTENFLRGSHNTHDAPITHKDAIFVRNRAREAMKKQLRLEKERDERPIR